MESTSILAVILLMLNLAIFFIFYFFLRSRFSPGRILSDLKGEVDNLIADLGREADRDVALLEHRLNALRSLIDEADKRLTISSREQDKKNREKIILQTIAIPEALTPSSSDNQEVSDASLPDNENNTLVQTAKSVEVYTRQNFVRRTNPITSEIPVHEKVLAMARSGMSAEFISATVSLPLGEVELIIDINSSSL